MLRDWRTESVSQYRRAVIDTAQRVRLFSAEVLRVYRGLPRSFEAQHIGKQLFRSCTAVGANMSEAVRSRSNAELVSKLECALQELEETAYWLGVLTLAGVRREDQLSDLCREANELTAILVASVKTIKARHLKR